MQRRDRVDNAHPASGAFFLCSDLWHAHVGEDATLCECGGERREGSACASERSVDRVARESCAPLVGVATRLKVPLVAVSTRPVPTRRPPVRLVRMSPIHRSRDS